jgi:hypothetical protein
LRGAARPEDSTSPNQIQDEQPTSECRIICVHQHCTLVLRRLSASSARTLDQLGKGCWRSWLLRAHIRLIHDACRRSRRALLSGLKARSTACVNVLLSLESSPVPVWASGLPKRHLDRHTFALAAAILSTNGLPNHPLRESDGAVRPLATIDMPRLGLLIFHGRTFAAST